MRASPIFVRNFQPSQSFAFETKWGCRVGSKIGSGDSAAYIIAVHGRGAAKHVLDLAWAVIEADPEPNPEEINRLARLMREIEVSQHQQIHRVAELYSA